MRVDSSAVSAQTMNVLGIVLFMGQFLYLWVTVDPYVAVTVDGVDRGSSLLNQLAALTLFSGSIMIPLRTGHPQRLTDTMAGLMR